MAIEVERFFLQNHLEPGVKLLEVLLVHYVRRSYTIWRGVVGDVQT